ncbi:arsenate reductase family protein [Thorsellia anophelis]|uniref:Arsenate reductase n=1 Tax=Thorsellia anophelis DSM 18579 TaxID=1123402 RepID=A0A1I0G3D1_9GAMM|nr:arsenate reductase family protein [Thorsellia anophelis]SET65103.1 arsenate reductase [Thorsellia anophelis DSM 18579]
MLKEYKATIYHNPACGTSRNVLKVMEDAGYQVEIIEYLKTGWNKEVLTSLLEQAGLTPKSALRVNKTPAESLGLTAENVKEKQILDAMIQYPELVNRPLVKTDRGVKMCRPSEQVLSLLEIWPQGPYYKEDGEMMIDEHNQIVNSSK